MVGLADALSAVLHGHVVSAEGHHFGASCDVQVVEGGFAEGFGGGFGGGITAGREEGPRGS